MGQNNSLKCVCPLLLEALLVTPALMLRACEEKTGKLQEQDQHMQKHRAPCWRQHRPAGTLLGLKGLLEPGIKSGLIPRSLCDLGQVNEPFCACFLIPETGVTFLKSLPASKTTKATASLAGC